MKFKQKALNEQTIVITGATSGIGLVTARMAARRGADLVLVARNEEALKKLADELNEGENRSRFVVADVAQYDELKKAANEAKKAFGGFDTWINNAGVSIYGNLEDIAEEDSRRLFDTNFWGVVNGSLIAAKAMHHSGGTIVNIGSTLSDRAIPLQGMYSASKHAVKGFTDALRMELEAQDIPIHLSLVKPAAVDTPYKDHAKNYLGVRPQNPAPVYSPETVAETILYCAENPVRDVFVGAGGKLLSAVSEYAPRLADIYMENIMINGQKTDEHVDSNPMDSLHKPVDSSLTERGGYDGHVAESSLYTKASLHPIVTGAAFAVGIGGAAFAFNRLRKASDRDH
jgi:short-subunit dehydrogenase